MPTDGSTTNVRLGWLVAGLTAGALNLADRELNQETLVALLRIQAETADLSDTHALSAALVKTSNQVAHGKTPKHLWRGDKDLDNDLDVGSDTSDDKAPIPTNQASSAMPAAGLGDEPTTELFSPKPGRRGLHKPKAWKQKKRLETRSGSQPPARSRSNHGSRRTDLRSRPHYRSPAPAKSSRGRPRTRSLSAFSKQATPVSPPPPSSAPKDDRPPHLANLTSDVEIFSNPEDSPQATPRAKDDSRSHVPPPAGSEMAPEAPARTGEASPATKKVPSSIDPGTPPYEATPLAGQGYEDEGVPFRDLYDLFVLDRMTKMRIEVAPLGLLRRRLLTGLRRNSSLSFVIRRKRFVL
ncbi:hypothetical protein GQ600_17759 [Phytophthora cactorum]|nr:hypothetical protein GQ600_17759 [Phytophthora cactorum]